MEKIKNIISSISQEQINSLILAIVIAVGFKIFSALIARILIKIFKTNKKQKVVENTFYKPLKSFLTLSGVYLAIQVIKGPFKIAVGILSIINTIYRIALILIIANGFTQALNSKSRIIKKLQEYGEVLTVHVADSNLGNKGEQDLTAKQIYERDIEWLEKSDLVIAEVSIPSLGIGYELGTAEKLGKKVICFYDNNSKTNLSAMIGGNENFTIVKYNTIEEVLTYIDNLNK